MDRAEHGRLFGHPGTGDISIFRNVQTGGNLSLIAGNNVLLQGATVAATNGQTVDGSVTVSAQAISINAGGSITIAAGDNVTASATGPGTNVAVATSNATLSATTTIDLTAVGGITIRGGNGTDGQCESCKHSAGALPPTTLRRQMRTRWFLPGRT
jgi:hypothetical protein